MPDGTIERGAILGRLAVGAAAELARAPIAIDREFRRRHRLFQPEPVDLLRPDDLVLLRCSFENLRWGPLDRSGAPTLVRAEADEAAYLIVRFPSQHIIEHAYFETSEGLNVRKPKLLSGQVLDDRDAPPAGDETPAAPPIWASLAGPTTLAFSVRKESIVYSTEGILDAMSRLDLAVAPNALPPRDERLLPWKDLVEAGNLETVALAGAARRGTRRSAAQRVADVELVTHASAVAQATRTARLLERRFGTESALRTIAASRIGSRIGVDKAILGGIRVLANPEPRQPSDFETAIELPWRLIVSPNVHGAWAHSREPVAHDGRLELWHTRMGTRSQGEDKRPTVDERPQHDRTIRAIWTRDFEELAPDFPYKSNPQAYGDFPPADQDEDGIPKPSRTSLNSRDRMMLVHETANFTLKRGTASWNPPAVPVERLMLSTMGGWLESRVVIPTLPTGPFSIEEWKHVAAMARDHEVKVVYAGFLLPFGHKASLIKITERKLHPAPDGRPVAYLFQRMFIIVREPEKQFGSSPALPNIRPELAMPLGMVRILTRVTPDLDEPQPLPGVGDAPTLFVPYVGGAPFLFKMIAVDRENHSPEYRAPLAFLERSRAGKPDLEKALNAYNQLLEGRLFERKMPLNGQRIAFAESDKPDDTTLGTDALTFDATLLAAPDWSNQDQPQFLPTLRQADVVVPAMSALAGAKQVVGLKYPDAYKKDGFAGNAGQVFFEVAQGPTPLEFAGQGDRSGGFVTPSISVTGLSRLTGPIGGDIKDAINGQFNPDKFFADIGARLFGIVKLSDLLQALPFDPANVPTFVGQALNLATTLADNARRLALGAEQVKAAVGAAITDQLQTALATFASDFSAFMAKPTGPVNRARIEDDLNKIIPKLGSFGSALDTVTSLPRAQLEQVQGLVQRIEAQLADVAALGRYIEQLANGKLLPEVVSARLDWSTEIPRYAVTGPNPPAFPAPDPDKDTAIISPVDAAGKAAKTATLKLAVDLQAPTVPGKEPSVLVSCSISSIDLRLIAPETFLILHFKKFEFSLVPGKKPDVNVVLADNAIEFTGPLKFVETLKDVIPFDGFSDPPYLDVTAQGINAGFTLAIPNLSVGVFSLENISVGAKLIVPFVDDSLKVGFNFCTRENPFRLSVMLFAGGGFVGVTVTPAGVEVLEAALEFGAAISVNFGVASGSLSAMAGIYFKIETNPAGDQACTLTGYFRLRGEVDVLGLISASIELYLALSYESETNKAVGQATLTIEVEVAFFSTSVKISAEKRFAGSGKDPTFVQMMGAPAGQPRPWDVYARAFA